MNSLFVNIYPRSFTNWNISHLYKFRKNQNWSWFLLLLSWLPPAKKKQALISGWKTGETMPFIYDTVTSFLMYHAALSYSIDWATFCSKWFGWTVVDGISAVWTHDYFDSETVFYSLIWQVWDLIKLADYLTQREDIDPSRIGITGVSLGGWLREVDRNMSDARFIVTHH